MGRVTAACSLVDCTNTSTVAEKKNMLHRNQPHLLERACKEFETNKCDGPFGDSVPGPLRLSVAHCRTQEVGPAYFVGSSLYIPNSRFKCAESMGAAGLGGGEEVQEHWSDHAGYRVEGEVSK